MKNCWLKCRLSHSLSSRPWKSVLPPGVNGSTSRTGFAGQLAAASCARARPAPSASAAPALRSALRLMPGMIAIESIHMSKRVEFFFDFGSPTAYLAYTQLPKLAMELRAEIVWRPMLLGGVFKATGNQSPVMIEPKGEWMFQDMAQWARRYGVPLQKNPWFI